MSEAGKVTDIRTAAAGVRVDVRALLQERGWSLDEAAARIGGMSGTTLSLWLREKYTGDNKRIGKLVARWLETERGISAARASGLDRHADLAVTAHVERLARHAHANADLVVVYGSAGAGKTRALKHYCEGAAGAWHVEMSPAVTTPASVLSRVARALDVDVDITTAARLEQAVVDRLSAGSTLLAVDEAHHLGQPLLDVVRCVHDQSGCGLVLAGNEPLWARLATGKRAAQLASRVGLKVRLRRPAEADAIELAKTLIGAAPTGKARTAVLAAASGRGGLRAVRKLIAQAHLLAVGDGRERAGMDDVADAAVLLGADQ